MNMLKNLFGRRARTAGGFTTETTPRRHPARRSTIGWAALAAGLLVAAGPQAARAAVSENFDSIFGTSYKDQTANGWRINSGLRSSTARSGSCARTASTGSANYLQYEGADGNGKDGGVGYVTFWYRGWDNNPQETFKVQYSVNGGAFTDLGSSVNPTLSYQLWSNNINDASDNIIVRIQQTAGERMLFDDAYISDYAASTPSITLTNNGTQVAAAYVAAGKTNHILHRSSLAVTTANATLTNVSFTTAGTYGASDITNLIVWFSPNSSWEGSDVKLHTFSSSLGAGLKTTAALSQVVTNATTGYLFITADIAPGATGGNTISINPGVATTNTQFTAGTVTGGTAAGGAQTIITAPAVTTVAASATNTTTATVNGNVTSDGSSAITNRGVCYKTSASVTIADNKTPTNGTTGAFSVDLSSLAVNQIYYYKAYAQNSVGTTLGSELNFTTRANTPSAPTVANPTTSSLDITVDENGNPSSTEFAIQRTSDSNYLQTDGSWGASAVWATKATWGTKTATGLSSSTEYFFQVKARNSVNVETAFGSTGSGTTSASGQPARWTALYNRGAPIWTNYLGDLLTYVYEFAIAVDTGGWTVEYGVGTTTGGGGWTWRNAEWSRMDGSDNRVWKSKASEQRFTSTGNWYYAGRFITGDPYTYNVDGDWVNNAGAALDAGSYFTVSNLVAPSAFTAATNPANSATRANLAWTEWNNKNALVTWATAAPSGSPTNGDAYGYGSTFGNQTVVAGSQDGGSLTVTNLTPGQTYYFTVYSENYSYYSTGTTAAAVTMSMPRARNTSGNASPGAPAGTIYLGDTAKVFTAETWGVVEANYGAARLWLRYNNADLSGGTPGALGAYINTDAKSVTSGVFTATGTWYWGIQMDYGSPYSTNFWYKASSAAWANLAANGTGATLSFTVSAINNPSSQTGVVDAVNYTSEIDLSWAQNAQSHDVMVVRKLSTDSWTEPTQGTAYAATDTIGSGTVIYNGSNLSASDTGLTEDTTYDYKFYSVNNDYYSAGVTDQESTAACEPDPPATLWASATNTTDFTAAWSASDHATNYYLDVSTNATFGGTGGGSETNLIISEMCDPGNNYSSDRYIEIFNAGGASVDLTGWSVVAVGNGSDIFTWTLSGTIGSSNALTCGDSGNTQFTPDFTGGSWSGANSSWNGKAGDGAYLVKSGTTIDDASSHGNFENKTTVRDATVGTGVTVFASGEWTSTGVTDAGSGASTPGTHDCSSVPSGSGGSSTPSYVPGYSNRLVGAGTSASVTGLTSETAYYYRVRAEGAGGCTSAHSTTASVTTVAATPYVALANNGTQVAAASVAGGTTAHILHRFQLTVTNADATLTGVGFTSAGSYVAADLSNFKVWYSANNTLETGSDTLLGTISTGLGAGAHSLSSLSQGITTNAIGYIFITADIAASPGCENTINVAAITTSDLTYATAANETGSTTAGGVQTLVAAEPTLHASALLFPSVGSDQLGVSWTSGNGDKRIVVVTEYDAAGLWLFDEGSGTTAKDATVNANDGTLYNTPTWSSRTGGGGALNFLRASSEYVEVLNNAALQTTNSQTISFWLRPTDFPGRQNPWNKAYGGEGTITLEPARHLNYYFGAYGGDGGSYDYVPSVSLLTAGQWKHLVVVRDMAADKMRWYFDGVLVNEATIVNNTSFAKASTTNLRFGSGYAGYLNGDMAEPMLLDRALTATEVANLYAMGSMATGWVPTDGTVPSGVNSDFSAADDQAYHSKIVYDGTGTNVTVTGLKPDTAYRVRVYEYSGAGACVNYLTDGTPASGVQATACPKAPTGLFANPTNTYDFTANWSASTGARGYIIDVSTNATFSGSGGTLLSEAFATLTATVPPTGWTSSLNSDLTYVSSPYFGEASPSYKFHTTGQTLTSPTFVTGATNLQFWAYGNGNSGSTLAVSGLVNSVWTLVDTVSIAQNGATYNVALNSQTTQIKFRFTKVVNVALDDVIVQAATGSYVPGFEHLPVSGTSVSVTGLEDSVTYYWRVAATGARCTGDYSVVTNVTTIAGPPPVPPNVSATDGTILGHVQVTWTDLNNKEQNFLVWRSTSSDSNTAAVIATLAANTVSYNDTTAALGTRYWYWVMSSNAMGASALSVSDSGFRKLPTVQNVQATDCTSVDYSTITWTDSNAGETGYGIWYSTTANSGSATWLANTAADTTTYNHAGTPGTLYYYWVRATNSTLATQSDFQASGVSGVRKLATVSVSASDGTDTARVVVQWTDIAGETGYSVWRSETDNSTAAEWQANVAANATSYDDEEAVAGTQYYYWVRGTNVTSGCYSDFGTGDGGWRRLVENPSSAELTRDGREMVRAAIAPNANTDDILVLYSTTAEVNGVPALNSSYSVGDTLGNAKVVYKGTATNFLEHVVSPNTTNHYRVFSVLSNIFYSSGPIPTGSPVETKAYQPNVGVETFSYTNVTLNTDSFTNKSGGANWATGSNWVLEASGTSWQVFTNDTYDGRPVFYTAASNMATHSGNRAFINLDGANRWGTATRSIPTVSTGTVFVSALMAYRYEAGNEGADRWLTMALMNGSDEELEFGKVWGANRTFTIRHGGNNTNSSYALNPYGDSTNNWYWVVLKYDFENDVAKAAAFYRGENIPSTEPATWDAEWDPLSIAQVTAVRLKAGSGTYWLGGGLFDEVRVSSVWPALLGEPDLVITPESKNFGDTEVGRTDVQRFWVENIGGDKVPLSVSSLTLGGTDPTNFFLSTNTLGTIEYGQSNSFVVSFIPDVVDQDYAATLYLTNSSGVNPVTVSLLGAGIPSQLTNAPAIDDYWVGETNQVTDAMVTSGVFSVVIDAYHPAGIATAKYDLLNGASTVILANQAFESWTSANGEDFVFSNATHTGYWPATPSTNYLVRVTLISSNGYGVTNTAYGVMGGVEASDLFISEYIEGSSNNKAIEIYNGTGAAVSLSSYTLRLYRNGGTSPFSISLSGTLAAGDVYVVAHSSASAAIQAEANLTHGNLDFNGNDVVALAKSGVNIDVVGTIGSSADFAKDVTKVRKSSVTAGVTTYAAGEWDNKASDIISFLGAHTMDGGVAGTPMRFKVIDDDTAAPVITEPLVNGATTPAGAASGPTIAIGDVPVGGFSVGWKVQDTDSGVFAASNHYTLKRSNAVVSAGAVTAGANGDGKASALTVSTTVARASMIWGNYVLSLAGHDYDPEWNGDISSVSNVYYFVIAAPSIGVAPASLNFGTVERDATSNRTVVVTNSGNADLVVSGIGFSGTGSGYFSVTSPSVPLTVTPGDSAEVVVSFTPTAGGTFNNVVMTLNNNSPDHAEQEVPITAVCFDPETAPPSIYDFTAVDSRVVTNEVTDHALGHSDVTLNFTLWHYAGMSAAGASYDLLDPAGNLVWTNGTFDAMTGVTLGTKDCQVFSATVPGFYPAVTGVYTARVTATSSNAYSVTDEVAYAPLTAGGGVPHILDRFSRPNAFNDIGAGWLPTSTGETNKNIQLRDHTLQFYGAGGTAGAGRLSVVRDMTGRYNTVLTNNAGTLTWAFNFYSGQANMTGLGSSKYAGLYVLGSTATNFVGGTGLGYAVRICSNQVALVKFTGGLNSDSDATTIGTPANLAATTPMGIRVNLDPATGTWSLYTTNWGGTGPDAFGDPLAAAELATSNVDSTYLGANNLKYVGCYWNHGDATPTNAYGAVFDDTYAPYVMPAAPLMNFTVVDEDWSGPVHSGFNAGQYTVSYIYPGGLTVTGLVADANGVYAGTSNVWTLFSNSTQVATGSMAMTPDTDGAGTTASPAALSTTIPFSALDTTNGTFTFELVSTDYDLDRPGDFLSTTSTFTIVIVDTEAPTPSSVTAVGDGMEMAVLTWNLNAAQGAVVLRSPNPDAIAGATILTMGTAYNQGDAGPNGTTVAYHGTNQTGAEIVLPMGSSNYFRLFGANGTVYSAGHVDPTNSVQLLEYEDGEIVDQFAYTNNYIWTHGDGGTNWMYLNDQAPTGQGWNGGWTGDSHKALTIENINLLCGDTQFPDPYANKLQWVANSQVATNVAITRKLATKRSGRTFIAFMMNYKVGTNSCSLTNKYLGLSLMSGTAADKEEIFFGKVHGYDKDGGIEVPGVATNVPASPDNYAFNAKHGDDYMIVGEWDPGIHTIRMWAFHQGDTNPIPQEYTNATPFVAYSNASLTVGDITGIRLAAGMTEDDTNSLDHVYFDEVRVGDTWDEVLLFNYPEAWNFRVGEQRGSGTNAVYVVTDGELAETGKAYPISYLLNHRTGVTNAQFNISTNTSYLTGLYDSNIDLQLNPANATDRSRWFTNWVTTRLHTNDITLGVYTTRVWMTAVSGKATNTIFMEGRAGATDLFFGEFGEGNNFDKYVEIYNGTGGTIDLSQYLMAHQKYGPGITPDYSNPWAEFCRLAATETLLPHGTTMLILNGSSNGRIDPTMTNALANAKPPRPFLITTNKVLEVSGNDPMGLFKVGETNEWIDMCGIGPSAARYIMRRLENAEVPRFYPQVVDTNQWDYREWNDDRPSGYTNLLWTAGLYDRDVGLGGYITFTVEDDDAEPPRMGTNSALMVGTTAPYTLLAPSNGAVEVVLTAWNFVGTTVEEAGRPWADSLLTNARVSCSPAYIPELIDYNNGGTSENDLFDGIDQVNKGVAGMSSIGTYFTQAETAWIQYEIELTSAEDMVLSWAEAGGTAGFNTAQLQWSSDGQTFNTNAAWPSWVPQTGGAATYVTRYAEFDGVVTPGLAKVYIRIVLGPGYGTASGTYRMDNVQLTGYPQEFQVTDGQIADSGNKFQFRANVYDTNSGLNKAQATMKLQNTDGTRVASKDIGDGSTTNSTLWWELDVTRDDITDYVNASLSGKGMTINVQVPDLDADRPNDQSWLNGRIGQVRVIDDDTKRPKLTLTSMKPLSSILAQWAHMSDTNSLLPTKSDAGVDAMQLRTKSRTDAPKYPGFSREPVTPDGYHYIEAWAWHGQQKCWLIEVTPEADMALTNLTFTALMHRTNGVSSYRIDHYVEDALKATILDQTYWVAPPGVLDPTEWYTRSHSWAPDEVVLEAGKVNQIRIYGLGSSNFGARWRISELTLWQAAMSDDGVTEVTDAEFTSGTFKLTGHAWDTGSGIASPTHATPAKRPMFSLNAPDGGVLVSNQLFVFTGEVADGGATTKEEGAFEGMLPTPVYTNVMLGEYTGAASVWDYDDDRTYDTLQMRGDLSMYVVDNDNGAPSTVGVVRVNGMPMGTITRETAPWTNRPEFIVSFDTVAVDTDPGTNYTAKQRMLTGVGEYRVTTNDITALAPSNRAGYGTPYPVAATNGALANYGFEVPNVGWTLTGDSTYHRYGYLSDFARPDEGTNCLKTANGGSASQTIEFVNLASNPPVVGVSGRYRCNTALGAVFRIEAFASSNLVTPVATSNLALIATDTNWASFSIDPATAAPIGDGTVELLKISLIDGGGNTTYWDDVRLSVGIGTNLPSMRFVATAANQGISNPNYLFAVDADNNRANDRLGGPPVSFVTAYDVTPPTQVGIDHTTGASTEDVDDPTTQFDVQWSTFNVGPDNPAHTNYPSWGANNRDLLSPWKTYKIYYGTFNSLDVPVDDNPSADTGFIYTNFIANSNYLAWSNKTWDTAIEDPSATGTTNYLALTNLTQNKIRIFDLDFDQDYVVVVVGVDRAGNEGPATLTSWATNNTIKFSLTRGWTIPKNQIPPEFQSLPSLSNTNAPAAAGLAWIASGLINSNAGTQVTNLYTEVRKEYDLIYWDAPTFQERTNNIWNLVATVQTNWLVDDGAQQRPPRGNMRFYRASYKDRWRTTREVTISNETVVVPQRPLASEEIYAVNNVILSEGQNFAAFHGVPYTNTFEGVFGGTECFPGGASALSGTKVEFFMAGTNAPLGEVYYLTESGRWIRTNDNEDVTSTPMSNNFFSRGFSITLPTPLPTNYVTTNAWSDFQTKTNPIPAMIWSPIAQVPTNNVGFSQVIHCGSRRNPVAPVYNVVALRLPVAAHPSQMNLVGSGFTPGDNGAGDEIYTLDTTTKEVLGNSTIYCNASGAWRKVSGGGVPAGHFKPNDVIVIVSKNGGLGTTWTWNYHPANFYTLPNRWMGWNTAPPPVSLAPEPTTQASGINFTNVSANQIGVGWTPGNGTNRIVVVRAGAATTWTPTDGIAPLGVTNDFPTAMDQSGGNKVCYDGAGNGFMLMGLNPNTTYYVTIFEYNGAAASANYFLGGAPANGSQKTN